MLLGDSSVGKTCLLVRFKDGAFLGGNFIATVGIDFRVRDAVKQPQSNSSHSCFLWAVMFTVCVCMYVEQPLIRAQYPSTAMDKPSQRAFFSVKRLSVPSSARPPPPGWTLKCWLETALCFSPPAEPTLGLMVGQVDLI